MIITIANDKKVIKRDFDDISIRIINGEIEITSNDKTGWIVLKNQKEAVQLYNALTELIKSNVLLAERKDK